MRIGVLTGGGDCPGLNAVIRAVVREGVGVHGHEFVGYRDGWRGPLEDDRRPLGIPEVRGILPRGGTILGSSRTNPFAVEGGPVLETVHQFLDEHGDQPDLRIDTGLGVDARELRADRSRGSAAQPRVTAPQVSASEQNGELRLSWDPSAYPYLTVTHVGASRTTLAQDLQGGKASLPLARLPAGGSFEFVLSDGLNSVRSEQPR